LATAPSVMVGESAGMVMSMVMGSSRRSAMRPV
jgi:hypothetical protein